ncbi:lysosomal alpha-mannosidase-like [Bacillus rossius redtenbacheri]|uniref:lysosomal alpha-mannosidase-like n=1 Tax=Bacillus rossius redtenbacheri TaxID=93214 RepID=UPI002FDCACBD
MTLGRGQILLVVVVALSARPTAALQAADDKPTCGFESCHETKEGLVNVHLIPHSHDDVGWVKTVDEYYYGLNPSLDTANVSMILDSVFQEIKNDPTRRYIQVETAYLWMWWQHQNDAVREQYRQLVQSGRIQMTGGGWSMPDEATTTYQALIDNFSWGFKFLNDTFGPCGVPNIGWQIDAFGHSRETASIMAAMGFQGTFLGHLDYQEHDARVKYSNLEMVWHSSSNLGPRADMFASGLYSGYIPPDGCCWDLRCGDGDIGKNTEEVAKNIITYVKTQQRSYRTKHLMMFMGNDFTYMNATRFFSNIDEVIGLVNGLQKNGSLVNLLYSTPSCYVRAVNRADPSLNTKSDDFLPFVEDVSTVWNGCYTSRPTLKYLERLANSFMQVLKQLTALARTAASRLGPLDELRRALGILQHHDAITGTHRQHVSEDYVRRLTAAVDGCEGLARTALNALVAGAEAAGDEVAMESCPLLNISQCEVSERNDEFVVTVYNPLSRAVSHYVRVPVREGDYSVTSLDGKLLAAVPCRAPTWGSALPAQLVPVHAPVLDLEERRSAAVQEVVFRAADLPPLGLRSYRVARSPGSPRSRLPPVADTSIGNGHLTVEIDSVSGLVKYITSHGTRIPVQQNFFYYLSRWDDGAYAFKPRTPKPLKIVDKATFVVYKGELVEEIHQIFNDWVSQVIRVYKEDDHVEFEWLVGTVPARLNGRNVVSKYLTGLQSNATFYTDSNGREMQRRVRNHRADFVLELDEPVAANYYPVPSRIVLRDEEGGLEFAVLTDRAEGGTSLAHGQVELMVHRRMITEDYKGLGEYMNDTQPARGKHLVLCGNATSDQGPSLAARQRLLAEQGMLRPWTFFSPGGGWPAGYSHRFSGLRKALPQNVHVLTLEPWGEGTVLLRLEHIMESTDDPTLSQNVTIDIQDLFATMTVSHFKETTLDGSQWLVDVKRFTWRTKDGSSGGSTPKPITSGSLVTLGPMEIRTFIVTVK